MLEVQNLHAWYGKSHILQGVDLSVAEGEIVSLLGRNGAGRSTTLKAVMGEVPPKGSIMFKGQQIAGLKSYEIARRGLGMVPENRDIFPTLSVRQNLVLGIKPNRTSAASGWTSAASEWTIDEMFAMFPALAARAHVPGGALSGGEQQMLCICRALMGNPDLLMIDEPTEGLAPRLVQQVADLLQAITARGTAILLVEQKLPLALKISHRLYIMGQGRTVFHGTPTTLHQAPQIRQQWLEV